MSNVVFRSLMILNVQVNLRNCLLDVASWFSVVVISFGQHVRHDFLGRDLERIRSFVVPLST